MLLILFLLQKRIDADPKHGYSNIPTKPQAKVRLISLLVYFHFVANRLFTIL